MTERITYTSTGKRLYFLDGKQVAEMEYKAATWQRDEARLKDMLASQTAPRGISDCTFVLGTENGRQFQGCPQIGDAYKKVTEAKGGSITGKKYLSGLARYVGDPRAWVSTRGEAQKYLEETGRGCEGTINITPADATKEPTSMSGDVRDDILDPIVAEIASQDPNPRMVDTVDLKEQVRDRIRPRWGKKRT